MFSHTLSIGSKKVKLLTNAMTAVYFKQIFHEDMLVFMMVEAASGKVNDAEAVEFSQKLCYIMKEQAAKADMKSLTLETYYEWLETMSQMDLIEASNDIIDVFREEMAATSTSKKKDEEQSAV